MTDKAKSLLAAAILGVLMPVTAHAAGEPLAIDPKRLGEPAPDDAYGAYQRGLYKTALSLAQERAKAGDAEAMTLAAEILSRGLGVPQDLSEAARLYGMAAEKGVLEAQFQTALFMLEGKYLTRDLARAKAYLENAVAGGHKLAAFNLAQLVMSKASNDSERKKAYDLFLVAAEAGLGRCAICCQPVSGQWHWRRAL